MTRMNLSNVLVIGSGAAGLRAAIAAHEHGAEVVVIGKRPRLDAHTVLASGGINAALGTRDPEDSWQQHFADTVREGYFLSDPRVVEITVRKAPAAVEELAAWGCAFAPTDEGALDQRFFGAHRWRRTCYAGDYSGRAILRTLAAKVDQLAIPFIEGQYVSRLLVQEGACFGAMAFDLASGERTPSWPTPWCCAPAAILASGGAAPRGATRTTARAWPLPSRPAAGSWTWSWCSSTPRECSRPRRRPQPSSPRQCEAKVGSSPTSRVSASWRATTPTAWSSAAKTDRARTPVSP